MKLLADPPFISESIKMNDILDTFPAYISYWNKYRSESIVEPIDGWRTSYMVRWPVRLQMQIEDYVSDGFNWREIARERVFPNLDENFPAMQIAYENLLNILSPVLSRAGRVLDYDGDLVTVIYVGIGLGAGWVTKYDNRPAILLGLENIAECGWINNEALTGLIAHEFGHVLHFHQRAQAKLPQSTSPWWQLYSEGFAMRCEHIVMEGDSWHMREREGAGDWVEWCRSNLAWLADEFIRTVDTGEPVRPFFGSWYDLQGYRQTGYFLGHELIRVLEADLAMAEIAVLADDDPLLIEGVRKIADQGV
jgi:hypothetical protein